MQKNILKIVNRASKKTIKFASRKGLEFQLNGVSVNAINQEVIITYSLCGKKKVSFYTTDKALMNKNALFGLFTYDALNHQGVEPKGQIKRKSLTIKLKVV